MDPVEPSRRLMLDSTLLTKFPEGYRHLAYLQSRNGFTVKDGLPGLRGPAVESLYAEGRAWLAGSPQTGCPSVSLSRCRREHWARSRYQPSGWDACACRMPTARRLTPDAAAAVLHKALDLGYTHLDTAALYGFGANETLIGRVLKDRRREFVLATKGGMFGNAQGQREIDGRPEMIRKNCEDSLQRLQTDVIDLYYLHRWDKRVPIEESMGAVADLVKEGKVRTIGLSEVSAATIRKAHRVLPSHGGSDRVLALDPQRGGCRARHVPRARHRVRGVQPAGARLPDRPAARRIGAAAEGHPPRHAALSGRALPDAISRCSTAWRTWRASRAARWASSRSHGCSRRAPHIIPIPGTTRLDHLEENVAGRDDHACHRACRTA